MATIGAANDSEPLASSRPLKAGIYAPIPSFFLPSTEDLGSFNIHHVDLILFLWSITDIPTFEAHVARVAKANVAPVICGSLGEAIHLSHAERVTLIKAGRRALDDAGLVNFPIIVGTGAASTRETLELSNEAAAAGADYVIVIASGYFAAALTRPALKAFFVEVAEKSPIPVLIYNCDQQSHHPSNLHPLDTLL